MKLTVDQFKELFPERRFALLYRSDGILNNHVFLWRANFCDDDWGDESTGMGNSPEEALGNLARVALAELNEKVARKRAKYNDAATLLSELHNRMEKLQ